MNITHENSVTTIDEYIDLADPTVRDILRKVRNIIRVIVPGAEECISYPMPAFKHHRVFIYFAAFKNHIGFYPPVNNDDSLIEELNQYRNEKGNLRFPLSEPIPYEVIGRVAKALYAQEAK